MIKINIIENIQPLLGAIAFLIAVGFCIWGIYIVEKDNKIHRKLYREYLETTIQLNNLKISKIENSDDSWDMY